MAQGWIADDDDLAAVVAEADRRGWTVGPAVQNACDEAAAKRSALRDRMVSIVTIDRAETDRSISNPNQ